MKNETLTAAADMGSDIAARAADHLSTTARDARHALDTKIAELKVKARKQQKMARAAMRSQVKKTSGYVRRNPMTGLGIAFAAGVVICGLLFRR